MVFGLRLSVLTVLLAAATAAGAAEGYRPGAYLNLDTKALTAPMPLGPSAGFEPASPADAAPATTAAPSPPAVTAPTAAAHPPVEDSRPVAETAEPVATRKPVRASKAKSPVRKPAQVARKRGNPLDAQAMDTRSPKPRAQKSRVQTWPCKSGGICNWQR